MESEVLGNEERLAGLRVERRRVELRLAVIEAQVAELEYETGQLPIISTWQELEEDTARQFEALYGRGGV